MIVIPVYDDSEVVELNAVNHLYLKPKAKLIITVVLPEEADQCKPLSNWDILEQLKNLVAPDHFSSLRVSKSTREFFRLEGETDTKRLSDIFVDKLNGKTLQLGTFANPLSIEVIEAPAAVPAEELPSQMVEDAGFITENNTVASCVHLEGLPCKWFLNCSKNTEKPSEEVLKNTFEKYGKIANVDIPMLDPYREESDESPLIPGGLQAFHAFLQYEDKSNAIDAIQSLQGMKLVFTSEDGKSLACDIKISVDTTNHFSEEAINKRTAERLKLQELEQQRKQEKEEEEAERKRKAEERKSRARKRRARLKRKLQRQKERDENGEQEQEACPEEAVEDTQEWEDRKLLLAQRRLESIKLLMVILDKVNDLVQINRLEEEQMNCEFAEEFSDYSVSTYSENSKVMFLPIPEEEEEYSHHKTEMDVTEDEEEIEITEGDAQSYRHRGRRESFSDTVHQNLNYDDNLDTKEIQVTKIHYYDHHPIIKLSHSQDVSDDSCSRKLKIYETDEFINYLLNYYRSPEYARLFLETKESSSTPWCRRVVSCKGNGFQVKLQSLNGNFKQMNFIPELEEETEHECNGLEAPIPESEENSQVISICRKISSDSQECFMDSEPEVPMTKPKARLVKSYERGHKRTWLEEVDSESTESNDELKKVLEEISSTSEYFSEELDGHSGKQSKSRKLSKKQRKMKQLNKFKHCKVSGHNPVCHHDNLLGQLLHSYCQRFKNHSKYKQNKACLRKPSLYHLYDSDTNESDSDMQAEVQTRWKRKRPKIINHPGFLEEKKPKIKRYSSSDGTSSSNDLQWQKKIMWRNQHKWKPKLLKADSCDLDEKVKKVKIPFYAEDVSESLEQDEFSWDGEETQSSFSSDDPTRGNEQRAVAAKGSYTDYLDWEQHFYTGDVPSIKCILKENNI